MTQDAYMKENGKKIADLVKVMKFTKMEIFTKVILKIINHTARELIIGKPEKKVVKYTTVNGFNLASMASVSGRVTIKTRTQENGKTTK